MAGDRRLSRRRVLAATAGLLTTGLAGCATHTSPRDQPTPTTTQATTSTTETATSTTRSGPPVFDQDAYDQMYEWWLQTTLNRWESHKLLKMLQNGEGPEKMIGPWSYPGYADTFKKEKMLATNNPKESVPWPAAATASWLTKKTNSGAISTENDAFIATIQKAYTEMHPGLDIHGGFITTEGYGKDNGVGHGVSFFFDETHGDWYHIDTTESQIFKLNDPKERKNNNFTMGGLWMKEDEGKWNPLTQWEKGEIDLAGVTYEEKMETARDVLSLANPSNQIGPYTDMWVSESALDCIYRHIWGGGELDVLLEPMQIGVYHQAKNPETRVGLYGETTNALTVAYGDDRIYNQAMKHPERKPPEWFAQHTTPVPSYQ